MRQRDFRGERARMMSGRAVVLAVVPILFSVLPGCKGDPVVDDLKAIKPGVGPSEMSLVVERTDLALSKWRNHKVDPEPILIFALLSSPAGVSQVDLAFGAYDEDKDIVGIGVKEDYTDANGSKTSRLDEYPAMAHRRQDTVVVLCRLPVQIRNAGQGMERQRWQDYANGEGMAADAAPLAGDMTASRRTLPPVWVSLPEPNRVDVYVYAYDRAGHKSDPVRLVNCLQTSESLCASNLKTLYAGRLRNGRRVFGRDGGPYPDPHRWCDVVVDEILAATDRAFVDSHSELQIRHEKRMEERMVQLFTCPSAGERSRKADVSGRGNEPNVLPQREPVRVSHYAMNINCKPSSRPNVVLLFESKAGWNQHGWLELFTFDNHDPKGGWVLLNDGTVKFIRTEEELHQLRWK